MKIGDLVWHDEHELLGTITEMLNPFVAMVLWASGEMEPELLCCLQEF